MHLFEDWPSQIPKPDNQQCQVAINKLTQGFADILVEEQLQDIAPEQLQTLYLPVAHVIHEWVKAKGKTLVIGINGGQGSGKTTLTKILKFILIHHYGLKVASFSIDDLYKTRQQRHLMAENLHPLFMTRGVPGTHDTELGLKLIQQLSFAKANTVTKIPVFDKSIDDRLPPHQSILHQGGCDLILFEGWCVGCPALPRDSLNAPINTLEEHEDPHAVWRKHINQQLETDYQELFSHLDYLLMLQVPNFEKIFEWRSLQEQKLATATEHKPNSKIMSSDEIARFIQHYERLTRFMLLQLPAKAHLLFNINDDHQISRVIFNKARLPRDK